MSAFAVQAYKPYFVKMVNAAWQPEEYDPESRVLTVKNSLGETKQIKGVLHAQVKTWTKMPNPDAYLRTQILNDPRVAKLNEKPAGRTGPKSKGEDE